MKNQKKGNMIPKILLKMSQGHLFPGFILNRICKLILLHPHYLLPLKHQSEISNNLDSLEISLKKFFHKKYSNLLFYNFQKIMPSAGLYIVTSSKIKSHFLEHAETSSLQPNNTPISITLIGNSNIDSYEHFIDFFTLFFRVF